MSFDMFPFRRFAYRNSLNLQTFNVSPGFVYITTHNEIHQYKRNSPGHASCTLPFKPLLTFLYRNTYFICSHTDLYYFRDTLNHIMPISPLTLNFEYRGFLISISEDLVSMIKLAENDTEGCCSSGECKSKELGSSIKSGETMEEATPLDRLEMTTQKLSTDNGICSAQCHLGSRLILGFENGVIGCVESGSTDICGSSGSISLDVLSELGEPVTSICCTGESIYSTTLESVFRIPIPSTTGLATTSNDSRHSKDDDANKSVFTRIKCRKVIAYRSLLLLQQDLQILFLSQNLNLIDVSVFQLEIKNLEIHQDSLFVGFACGLLIEYDLSKVNAKLAELHEKPYLSGRVAR